jgi:hypothetical protein
MTLEIKILAKDRYKNIGGVKPVHGIPTFLF